VNHHFKNLSLYQLVACPFCVKVRRELKRLGIQPPLVNILDEPKLYEEMLKQGGRDQVPCLRINQGNQVTWLYESNEIIRYLRSELDTLKLSS
jgi:glutaredoxin